MSATQCYQNLIEFCKLLGNAPSNKIKQDQKALQVDLGMHAPLINPIFLNELADSNTLLNYVNPHFSFWLDSIKNHNLQIPPQLELLLAAPVMSIDLNQTFKRKNTEIQIVELNSSDSLKEWAQVVCPSFDFDAHDQARYVSAMLHNSQHIKHFLAKLNDGTVVGAASLFLPEQKELGAGFYCLAVLPQYRKQSIGHDLHMARLNKAKELGYRFATLQATPHAAHLDASIGFKELSKITIYIVK